MIHDDDDDDDDAFLDDADAIYVKLHDIIMRNDVKKCKHLIETMEIDLNKQFRLHKKVTILNFLVFVYQNVDLPLVTYPLHTLFVVSLQIIWDL